MNNVSDEAARQAWVLAFISQQPHVVRVDLDVLLAVAERMYSEVGSEITPGEATDAIVLAERRRAPAELLHTTRQTIAESKAHLLSLQSNAAAFARGLDQTQRYLQTVQQARHPRTSRSL